MYRVRSSVVWFALPGVVAAYQPIMAPDPVLARANVRNEMRTPGQYAAALGVAPGWAPRVGWTFNGGTQYLNSVPSAGQTITLLVQFSNSGSGTGTIAGARDASATSRFFFIPKTSSAVSYRVSTSTTVAPGMTSGSIGVTTTASGGTGWKNGLSVGAVGEAWAGLTNAIKLGASSDSAGAPTTFWSGNVQAVLIALRTFTASEMFLATQQMAYCHINSEWSAWSRRRMYYYAPTAAAAFNPAWARNANQVHHP